MPVVIGNAALAHVVFAICGVTYFSSLGLIELGVVYCGVPSGTTAASCCGAVDVVGTTAASCCGAVDIVGTTAASCCGAV